MDRLNEYVAGRGEAPSYRDLSRLVDEFEWFTMARRARAIVSGERDLALALPLGFWPTVEPQTLVAPDPCETISAPPAPDLIDRFISSGGDRRIVPARGEEEVAAARVDIDIDPEMVSPQLAEIYRAQGLTEKADEIYRLLNLQNR